ncbi:hypothetical protein [Solidesulfovibrio sp. C21]|uniref:hypothetical protein n=1 Tax=Solidesulfovibrio sp. C21 TaxID=3398613 RepID=UPI0039FD8A00
MPSSNFICLRYYVVPVQYDLFRQNVGDIEKNNIFRAKFLVNNNYRLTDTREYAVRINSVLDGMYYGKLSKKNIAEKHELTPTDIQDDSQDDWPYLNFVADTTPGNQLFVVEKKAKIFQSIEGLKNILRQIAKKTMMYTGFTVNFEPIVKKLVFWNIIKDSDSIYSLKFSLESPNMLGASATAREGLKELQTIFNNSTATVQLENPDGQLIVPETRVETYREYVDQGGGSWELGVGQNGEKKTYRSIENAIQLKEKIIKEDIVNILAKVVEKFKALL